MHLIELYLTDIFVFLENMSLKEAYNKLKTSRPYIEAKELFTLGGNSKFAPSSLAFFVMVSLVPVITMIVYILSFFGYTIEDLLNYLQKNLDLQNESMLLLEHYFFNIPNINKIFLGIGIFILIYISSRGITFFMYAYSKISNTPPKFKKFWQQKLGGALLSIILEVFLAFLIVFLGIFDNFINDNIKVFHPYLFFVIISIFIFIFLLFLYSISSSKKEKFKDIFLGALISSLSITLGMTLYIFYLDHYSNAQNYYGSLTSFILLLLIIYYSSYITLLGVQINTQRKKEPSNEDSLKI